MQPHDVLVRIMQNHSDGGALNNSREFLDEVAKQFGKILMKCNGFRDVQESVILRRLRFEGGP